MTLKIDANSTPQNADDLAKAEAELTRALQRGGSQPNIGEDTDYIRQQEHENIRTRPRAGSARTQISDIDGQAGGGRESTSDYKKAYATDLAPATGSIMDTLRGGHGDPKPVSEATKDDTVTVDGMEISLGVAEQLGLVARDTNGNFYDPRLGLPGSERYYQSVEQHREEVRERAEDSTANALRDVAPGHNAYLGDEAEQTLATLVRNNAALAGDLVSQTLNALAEGSQPDLDYHAIAAALGKEGNAAVGQSAVARVADALNRQAHDIFESHGAYDTEKALAWARQHSKAVFRDAIARQVEGDVSGLENLAAQFAASGANALPMDADLPDPASMSDQELVTELEDALPEGARVWMEGNVAWFESPEHGRVPLRTLVEMGKVYWG